MAVAEPYSRGQVNHYIYGTGKTDLTPLVHPNSFILTPIVTLTTLTYPTVIQSITSPNLSLPCSALSYSVLPFLIITPLSDDLIKPNLTFTLTKP